MDGRRPAQAGAQNPAYRPAHPLYLADLRRNPHLVSWFRPCSVRGHASAGEQVTVLAFELDEDLLARCAQLGVTRYVALAPASDPATMHSFLDRCSQIADRVGP